MTTSSSLAVPAANPRKDELQRCFAEFVGTFILVFGGVGCAVLAGKQVGTLGVAFAFGLALLAMVYAVGPISGCHVNPAVTLGLLLAGKFEPRRALGYWVAQILGATLAAFAVLLVARGQTGGYDAGLSGLGANGFGAHSPQGFAMQSAFAAEFILTMVLVLTVLFSTDARAPVGFAGLAIGLVLTLVHLVGIPVTNTSVNPARSLGPALFVGGWALEQLWLFVVAPLLGGAAAAAVYHSLRVPEREKLTPAEAERSLKPQQEVRVAHHSPA